MALRRKWYQAHDVFGVQILIYEPTLIVVWCLVLRNQTTPLLVLVLQVS